MAEEKQVLFSVIRKLPGVTSETYTLGFYSDGTIDSAFIGGWEVKVGKVMYVDSGFKENLSLAGDDVQRAYQEYVESTVAKLVLSEDEGVKEASLQD